MDENYTRELTSVEKTAFREYLDTVIVKVTKLRQDLIENITRQKFNADYSCIFERQNYPNPAQDPAQDMAKGLASDLAKVLASDLAQNGNELHMTLIARNNKLTIANIALQKLVADLER